MSEEAERQLNVLAHDLFQYLLYKRLNIEDLRPSLRHQKDPTPKFVPIVGLSILCECHRRQPEYFQYFSIRFPYYCPKAKNFWLFDFVHFALRSRQYFISDHRNPETAVENANILASLLVELTAFCHFRGYKASKYCSAVIWSDELINNFGPNFFNSEFWSNMVRFALNNVRSYLETNPEIRSDQKYLLEIENECLRTYDMWAATVPLNGIQTFRPVIYKKSGDIIVPAKVVAHEFSDFIRAVLADYDKAAAAEFVCLARDHKSTVKLLTNELFHQIMRLKFIPLKLKNRDLVQLSKLIIADNEILATFCFLAVQHFSGDRDAESVLSTFESVTNTFSSPPKIIVNPGVPPCTCISSTTFLCKSFELDDLGNPRGEKMPYDAITPSKKRLVREFKRVVSAIGDPAGKEICKVFKSEHDFLLENTVFRKIMELTWKFSENRWENEWLLSIIQLLNPAFKNISKIKLCNFSNREALKLLEDVFSHLSNIMVESYKPPVVIPEIKNECCAKNWFQVVEVEIPRKVVDAITIEETGSKNSTVTSCNPSQVVEYGVQSEIETNFTIQEERLYLKLLYPESLDPNFREETDRPDKDVTSNYRTNIEAQSKISETPSLEIPSPKDDAAEIETQATHNDESMLVSSLDLVDSSFSASAVDCKNTTFNSEKIIAEVLSNISEISLFEDAISPQKSIADAKTTMVQNIKLTETVNIVENNPNAFSDNSLIIAAECSETTKDSENTPALNSVKIIEKVQSEEIESYSFETTMSPKNCIVAEIENVLKSNIKLNQMVMPSNSGFKDNCSNTPVKRSKRMEDSENTSALNSVKKVVENDKGSQSGTEAPDLVDDFSKNIPTIQNQASNSKLPSSSTNSSLNPGTASVFSPTKDLEKRVLLVPTSKVCKDFKYLCSDSKFLSLLKSEIPIPETLSTGESLGNVAPSEFPTETHQRILKHIKAKNPDLLAMMKAKLLTDNLIKKRLLEYCCRYKETVKK